MPKTNIPEHAAVINFFVLAEFTTGFSSIGVSFYDRNARIAFEGLGDIPSVLRAAIHTQSRDGRALTKGCSDHAEVREAC
jgi:hypothetical protein